MGRVVGESANAEDDFRGFTRVGIVGLGLIGGSLALAIRERWPETVIVGVDRPEALADAVTRGAIARGVPRVAALAGEDLDLVVLAAPVLQNVACLQELRDAATRPLLVTDVGSTKLPIVMASRGGSTQHLTFVGGHPIAGAAHGGIKHARADLFRGRPWLFTPDATTPASAMEKLSAFVRALGAETATLDPAEHDRVMAYVSHLPQLAASALMRVAGENVGAPGFALSGAGLSDTTRLASSPASMWTEILQSNAEHVRAALDAFINDLQVLRDRLTSPAASGEWLEAGARWRAELAASNGTTPAPTPAPASAPGPGESTRLNPEVTR
jgi:prephenate dehydrogenase